MFLFHLLLIKTLWEVTRMNFVSFVIFLKRADLIKVMIIAHYQILFASHQLFLIQISGGDATLSSGHTTLKVLLKKNKRKGIKKNSLETSHVAWFCSQITHWLSVGGNFYWFERQKKKKRFWKPDSSETIETIFAFIKSYSCPSLVVPFLEELISRPFLDENRFRLVSQDRMSAKNAIGYLVFISRSLFV